MAIATLFTAESVASLQNVMLHSVTYTADPDTYPLGGLARYPNLAQSVGRSRFQYDPTLFSDLFTHESMYKVPVLIPISPDASHVTVRRAASCDFRLRLDLYEGHSAEVPFCHDWMM